MGEGGGGGSARSVSLSINSYNRLQKPSLLFSGCVGSLCVWRICLSNYLEVAAAVVVPHAVGITTPCIVFIFSVFWSFVFKEYWVMPKRRIPF